MAPGAASSDPPARLIEELMARDAEALQDVGQSQFFLRAEYDRLLVGAEDMRLPRPRVEDDHLEHAGRQVLADLLEDLSPGIAGRADLKDEFGDLGPIAGPEQSLRRSGIAVI